MATYVESVAKFLEGKFVEVYTGDQYESVQFADNTTNTNSIMYGVIKSADGDCLVLDSMHYDKSLRKLVHGNIIYLNGLNIHAITEVDGFGTIKDAIMSMAKTPNLHPTGKHLKNIKDAI